MQNFPIIVSKMHSYDIVKSPRDLGYLCSPRCEPQPAVDGAVRSSCSAREPGMQTENFPPELPPVGPAMAVNSLVTPPPGIPRCCPHPWECWLVSSRVSPPSRLGLKKLERRRLLNIPWEKGRLCVPSPAGLQEPAKHPCLEQGQAIEQWVSNHEHNILESVLAIVPTFSVSTQRRGNLC